jgi:four helix bundle protein
VLSVYEATRDFPKEELYGLTSQLRRAAGSLPGEHRLRMWPSGQRRLRAVPANRNGAALELEYHLLLARDLGYLAEEWEVRLRVEVHELKSMLSALLRRVKSESIR